ncbi:MAG TPA: EpsI family protein [Thiobacillaceae bacterium]|nr:EpsI family protein [Thiobacillaceae bacterium]
MKTISTGFFIIRVGSEDVRKILVGAAMLMAALIALAMTPDKNLAESRNYIDLEQVIPKEFGDWKIDEALRVAVVNPEVQAKIDAIYSQNLMRTYINSRKQRIMLSIAYGGNQLSEKMQVHRPEYCYKSQGFNLSRVEERELMTPSGKIPVRRMIAVQGRRFEPITYWITVGEVATLPGFGRKLAQISYGLTGKVPDGMLVRVSTIGLPLDEAYRLEDGFIYKMLESMPSAIRVRVAGT